MTRRRSASAMRSSSLRPSPSVRSTSAITGLPKRTLTGETFGIDRPRGQACVCAFDPYGDSRHSAFQHQLTDARHEAAAPAIGRPPAFRKPHLRISISQHTLGGCQGGFGARLVDREQVRQPREDTFHRRGEQQGLVAGPVRCLQAVPSQRRGNDRRIEIARVVGRNDEGPLRWQVFEPCDAQAESRLHGHGVGKMQHTGSGRLNRTHRCQPAVEIESDVGRRVIRLGMTRDRNPQEISDRVGGGDIRLTESNAKPVLQEERQFHPREGVEAEIDGKAHIQIDRLFRVALLQKSPQLFPDRIVDQRHVLLGEGARLSPGDARERLAIKIRQQKASQLAKPGARQSRLGQRESRDAFIGRQANTLRGERNVDPVSKIESSLCPQCLHVRPHQRHQRAVIFKECDLGNTLPCGIDFLEILRAHLLSAAEHDGFLGAPGDEEKTVGRHMAEVTRSEPTVRSERRGIGGGVVEIAAGNGGTLEFDFAIARCVRRSDPHLALAEGLASASSPGGAGQVACVHGGCFRQAIARQHRPPEHRQAFFNSGIEPRAATDQQPQARRKAAPHGRKQYPADRHSCLLEPCRKTEAAVPQPSRQRSLGRHPLIQHADDGLVETRNSDQYRRLATLQRLHDQWTCGAFRKHDGRADGQCGQHADNKRIGVIKRQRQERAVCILHQAIGDKCFDVARHIPDAEWKQLRLPCGAGCPAQHDRIVPLARGKVIRLAVGKYTPRSRIIWACVEPQGSNTQSCDCSSLRGKLDARGDKPLDVRHFQCGFKLCALPLVV